jgi:hypothetical protein
MTPPENQHQKLDHLMQKTLGDLPPRRAPVALEERVLAEIARRAAMPWWRKSYAHWPLVARCAFLLGSGAVLKGVIMAAVWVLVGFETASYHEAFASSFPWINTISALAGSLVEYLGAVLAAIPRFWLYAGVICVTAMYATLFGVGAFAYRVFHARRVSL